MIDNGADGFDKRAADGYYYDAFKTSTEMEFQAIVDKARSEVAQGNEPAASVGRRSSRRLQQQGDKPGPSGILYGPTAMASARGKRPAPPQQTLEARISVGSRHQAELVDLDHFKMPSDEQREAEDERSDCWWQPDDESQMLSKDLEDFIVASRRHMDVGIDMAMKAVYNQNYDVVKALEHMEEEYADYAKTKFTKDEDNALVYGLYHCGKYFGKIAKKHVQTRTVGECARRYYDIKKKICYNTNAICPTLMRATTDDYKSLKRSECENCSVNLFERIGKCEVRGRRKTLLCPPCDMYARLKKMYRPCTVKYQHTEGEMTDIEQDKMFYETTGYFDLNQYMTELAVKEEEEEDELALLKDHPLEILPPITERKDKSDCVHTEPHKDCFFIETADEIRWDMSLEPDSYDKEKAVDGFLRFGKNFSKIASYSGMKHEGIAKQFYDVYAQDYRLDFLIAQFNARHQSKAVLSQNNDSDNDDDDENYINRGRMPMRGHSRRPAKVRTRAWTTAGVPLRRTTRMRRAAREMS